MEKVVLLSTGCPRCKILEMRLKKEGILFDIIDDENKIKEMGFMEVPVLKYGERFMNFKESLDWLSERKQG